MSYAHFFLQHKGGIGKSVLAKFYAQYLAAMAKDSKNYDADPMNQSFAELKRLDVTELDLMDCGNITKKRFDVLSNDMAAVSAERPGVNFVIDTGASSYPVLSKYLEENQSFKMMKKLDNITAIIHCPMVGGDMYVHTAVGFASLTERFPDTQIVVWQNQKWGPVAASDGVPFQATELYKQHKKQVKAFIALPESKDLLIDDDISFMLENHLTFEEIEEGDYPLMTKRRLKMYWDELCTSIDAAKI